MACESEQYDGSCGGCGCTPSPVDGTPRALGPIAHEVLALVARARRGDDIQVSDDDLRRIELCALATLDISMFAALYAVLPRTGHICHGNAEGACDHG